MIKIDVKYSPFKKVLAVVMAVVLVFSLAMPGFAAYGDGIAVELGNGATATPSDLPTIETQTTSSAALTTGYIGITPYNTTINIADLIAAGVNAGSVAEGWVFFAADNFITIQNANPLTFTGGTPENMLDAEIIINGNVTSTANITIENLHLNRVSTGNPIAVVQGASLNLTISATNTLQNGGVGGAGILTEGAITTLTIDGTGSLTARGHGFGAGIGGVGGVGGGNITILPTFNGTINAYGGANGGAGIGGGSGANGGNVTIGGGVINATGGGSAPGIGAGQGNNNHSTLNVTGGTVTVDGVIANGNIISMSNPNPPTSGTGWTFNPATNRYTVTGDVTIRGDNGTSNRTILVSGSPTLTLDGVTVTVSTIGIHGPPLETGGTGNVTLNLVDGTTNSFVSTAGGGTEGISPGSTGNLTINGTGTLVAMGTGNSAGIGFFGANNLGHITINSGTVIATGGPTGPGFGNASITINGGTVTANGNGGQPGFRATGDNITINPAATINSTPRPQITFDTGSGTAVSPQDVGAGNRLANFPTNPTRGTDTFGGWWDTSAATGGNQITAGPNGTVFPNNATIYARWTAAPSATIGNVTIGNAGGNVVITLVNDTFAAALTNTGGWITNLPAGMTQTATRNSDTQVTITISGGAEWTHTAMPIAVSIPAASLMISTTNLVATTNPSAVFTTLASRITAPITAPQPNGGAAWNATDESGNITRNVVVTLPGRIYTSATITASGTGVSGSASLAATDSGDTITVPVTVPGTRPADLTVTFTLTGDAAQSSVPPYIFWNSVTITVPATTAGAVQEPTPTAAINFTTEQLTGFASGEVYLINGTAHTATGGVININPAWMGTTISIVKQGTGTNSNSDPQSLAIPARPVAPSGIGSTNTTGGNNNGTITGVDNTMEYRTGTGAWIAVSGADTTITGLAADTYEVRVRATASAFASASASVTIAPSSAVVDVTSVTVSAAGSATSITTNGGTLQMSATVLPANATNPAVTWSIASGSGATINTSGLLTATSNGTVTVRATSVSNPSVFGQLQITISGQGTGGGNNNNGTSGSDPSPDYGWLNPSSTSFDLANPRSIAVTFTQRDFAFQNALRLGSGNNAINLVRDTDFTVSRNNNTFTVTISEDFLAENLTVGTRSLHFILSGNRTISLTIRVTDTRPVTTPDPLPDDEAPAMPIVQVDLSPALRAELMERLGDRFDDLDVIVTSDIAQATPQGAAMGDIHGFWDVNVEFIVRGDSDDGADDEIITGFANHYYLSADMSNFYFGNLNHHRITALSTTSNAYRQYGYIGNVVGGKVVFDPIVDIEAETPAEIATFALQSNQTGEFMIAYVRNLIRLDLNLNSPTITDLAGNAPQQIMDVLPIIQDGRTLIPIRFIGDALGAEIDWTNATADRPLTVYLTLNGQTLSFGIGEITPELAALGMDVPAQLMGNRTMVPLRFISEFFGAVVNWDDETRGIEIISIGYGAGNNPNQSPTGTSNALTSIAYADIYNDRRAAQAIEEALRAGSDDNDLA